MTASAELGVDLRTAGLVVVATLGIYLALLVCVRVCGQRSLAAMSATDVACVIALGAVVGRTTLLATPTLTTGVIALAMLFAVQRSLSLLRRNRVLSRVLAREPVLLVRAGLVQRDGLRRARMNEDDLRQRLRVAGVARLADVDCVVLERNGVVSVLRAGPDADPWLMADVPGYDEQYQHGTTRPQRTG
ncbi:MAG: DUF421 domain-containing protein [Pseudonocardia sp.]|uniref:DUF421 domain-containing protein n=1 Tax=unclassified Pseudonocardia TaxID=2619320 RepID=UPI00086A34DE|nr:MULTISPECIES: YetF domain-containing protein [unclassified Pseudonocardia]MBN9110728.1 DUF421 domain-containing protein [Pseudonocardia sp.]ODU27108.1 MAG: hypothetical protein ABS80_04490 [Pseudonocardia sp. SCN 72-51]ODV04431.1 MAG: hypothetical protein ABT15_20880 [Pseudonocardia sp. SCN 73-27]